MNQTPRKSRPSRLIGRILGGTLSALLFLSRSGFEVSLCLVEVRRGCTISNTKRSDGPPFSTGAYGRVELTQYVLSGCAPRRRELCTSSWLGARAEVYHPYNKPGGWLQIRSICWVRIRSKICRMEERAGLGVEVAPHGPCAFPQPEPPAPPGLQISDLIDIDGLSLQNWEMGTLGVHVPRPGITHLLLSLRGQTRNSLNGVLEIVLKGKDSRPNSSRVRELFACLCLPFGVYFLCKIFPDGSILLAKSHPEEREGRTNATVERGPRRSHFVAVGTLPLWVSSYSWHRQGS